MNRVILLCAGLVFFGVGCNSANFVDSSSLGCSLERDVQWTYGATVLHDGASASTMFTLSVVEESEGWRGSLVGVLSSSVPAIRIFEGDVLLQKDEGSLVGSYEIDDGGADDIVVICDESTMQWHGQFGYSGDSDFYPPQDMTLFAHSEAQFADVEDIEGVVGDIFPIAVDVEVGPIYSNRFVRVSVLPAGTITDPAYVWLEKNDMWRVVFGPDSEPDVGVLQSFPEPLLVL